MFYPPPKRHGASNGRSSSKTRQGASEFAADGSLTSANTPLSIMLLSFLGIAFVFDRNLDP